MAELDDRRLSRPNAGAGRMQRLVLGFCSSMRRPESSQRPAGSSSMSSRAAAWSGSPRGRVPSRDRRRPPRAGSHRRADASPRPRRHPVDVAGGRDPPAVPMATCADGGGVRSTLRRPARINPGPVSRRSCWSNHVRSAGSSGRRAASTWSRSPRLTARPAVFFTLRSPPSWPAMTVWSSTWVTGISKGHQIEANTRSVLERAAGRRFDRASWSRVAITDDQVRECGLAPVWKVDNRHRPARDHEAWEARRLSARHDPAAGPRRTGRPAARAAGREGSRAAGAGR
jgi:hypothetical protein